jgi:hypothetical protein
MSDNKGLDLLGIQPIANAVNTTVTKSFEGIEGFLKLVCAPALEEVGFLLKDQIRNWRLNNILTILEKAKNKMEFSEDKLQIKAHPKIALSIIENGSLNDNDEIQNLWAGLFVSSCTNYGQDDENLIFVDILKQLTVLQVKIINYSCEKTRKIIYPNGLIMSEDLNINFNELINLTNITDIHRLDRELDHLRSLELIGSGVGRGGFLIGDEHLNADITPTALALNLYLKSQGYNDDPVYFWKENLITDAQLIKEEIEEKEQNK